MTQVALAHFTYPTPHGPMTIEAGEHGVTRLVFGDEELCGERRATAVSNLAATQVHEYLAGKRTSFDVPIDPQGSAFQKAVWAEVGNVPYGRSCTAADVACALGKAGAHRSVGTAVRRNPIPILIPTHRIDLPNATGRTARIFRALRAMEQANAT